MKSIKLTKNYVFYQDHTQHYKEFVFRAFDPVVIRLSLDTTNVQREKIVFELVQPFIPGFSVKAMDVDSTEATEEQQPPVKRKSVDTTTTADDETQNSPLSTKTKGKKNKKAKKWMKKSNFYV